MSARLSTIFICLFGVVSLCTASSNAGIVQGIWLSRQTGFAGEKLTVYAAVQNHSDVILAGGVTFYVNEQVLGEARFTLAAGDIQKIGVPFVLTYGEKKITALIQMDGEESALFTTASTFPLFVDDDTDGDRSGNKVDTDDDGDGISDVAELSRGTHPLKSDSDGDGVLDGVEIEKGMNPLSTDSDGDGLADNDELRLGGDPQKKDTDGDGLHDGEEVRLGGDLKNSDTDANGVLDGAQVAKSGSPVSAVSQALNSVGTGVSSAQGVLAGVQQLLSKGADVVETLGNAYIEPTSGAAKIEVKITNTPQQHTVVSSNAPQVRGGNATQSQGSAWKSLISLVHYATAGGYTITQRLSGVTLSFVSLCIRLSLLIFGCLLFFKAFRALSRKLRHEDDAISHF